MKKILLFGIGLFLAGSVSSQVIFSGLTPASIQGNYTVTFGDIPGGWGGPDMTIPANSIVDTLVQLMGPTATDTIGCNPASNAADVAGQIAVLYRGDCQFGEKVATAEAAGAIACVIINNVPGGPVGMAPGTAGANTAIPVVMIGLTDGQTLLNEMGNSDVTAFIGNKSGYYENDLGTKISEILRPKYSSVPASIATNGIEYPINIQAHIHNYGSNDQTNVALAAIIKYNGAEIYNDTTNAMDMLSGDSVLFTLPTFEPASWDEGYYEFDYIVVSDSTDDFDADNTFESDFVISGTDLSYASIDETELTPQTAGGSHPIDGDGDIIPEFASCIHFRDVNASRLAPQAISFTASKGSDANIPSLEGEQINVSVYEYNDNFTDLNDPNLENPIVSINQVMSKNFTYQTDSANKLITVPFNADDIIALSDDQRYLFCALTYNGAVYFSTDPDRDYRENLNFYLQPLFPIKAADDFNPVGFGADYVPGVTVSFVGAAQVSLKEEKLNISMNVYPSPATQVVNVDFNEYDVNHVELINLTGQTVTNQSIQTGASNTTLDVSGVENGVYIVRVTLENQLTKTMRVVVSH